MAGGASRGRAPSAPSPAWSSPGEGRRQWKSASLASLPHRAHVAQAQAQRSGGAAGALSALAGAVRRYGHQLRALGPRIRREHHQLLRVAWCSGRGGVAAARGAARPVRAEGGAPLLDSITTKSPCCTIPMSPCSASTGARKMARVPVLTSVCETCGGQGGRSAAAPAAGRPRSGTFLAMNPDFPTPVKKMTPLQVNSCRGGRGVASLGRHWGWHSANGGSPARPAHKLRRN